MSSIFIWGFHLQYYDIILNTRLLKTRALHVPCAQFVMHTKLKQHNDESEDSDNGGKLDALLRNWAVIDMI